MYKVDLHTHSIASPDGGLRLANYQRMLASGRLDIIAITDHGRIDFGLSAQDAIGADKIIVGQEIMTASGEIIGLYLQKSVPAGLSIEETVAAIRAQNGLVYVPHPFETARRGLQMADLEKIASNINIIEIYNGRAVFQNYSQQALAWAAEHKIAGASSSDAHGRIGWGRTGSWLADWPTSGSLARLLQAAKYDCQTVGCGIIYPKFNRLKQHLSRRV
ncbi:MAG: PHP domain-containing protein [Candidatus Saccharimonadales bacterium]